MKIQLKLDSIGNPYIILPTEYDSGSAEILEYFKRMGNVSGIKLVTKQTLTGNKISEIHVVTSEGEK